MTVDAELGLVLSAKRANLGVLRSWGQFGTDADLDDEVFHYDNP